MPSSFPRRTARLAAALLLVAAPLALATAVPVQAQAIRGHGDAAAEAFVQTAASKALSILNDRSLGAAEKKQAFHSFVDQFADVPRITDFVLGRYRRSITPDQYARFSVVFRHYADSIYETRLGAYDGENLQVTGSVVRAPGDVVVSSVVTGAGYKGDATVNWRVLKGAGGWKVVDVQAQGVWLAIVQQQDFTSTLSNHGGDVNILIRQLQSDATSGRPTKAD